jgi:hypothetical protein
MKKPLPIFAIIGSIVAVLALVGLLYWKGGASRSGAWSSEQRQLADALDRVGGDPAKLDPATRQRLEAAVTNNPNSTAAHYSMPPPSSSGMAPATGRAQPMATGSGYPGGR